MGEHTLIAARLEQILASASRVRSGAQSPRSKRAVLVVSSVAFAVVSVLAFRSMEDQLRAANWTLVLIASGVGATLSQFLNSLEFREIGRASGTDFSVIESVRISLIGSAANLLPIPGSVIVRLRAISTHGSSLRKGAAASAGVGAYFVGVTLFVAGLVSVVSNLWFSAITACVGAFAVAGAFLLLRGVGVTSLALHVRVVAIELLLVVIGGLRITLVLTGLGFDISLAQGVGLTVAGAITTAVGFFPGGLGLREGLVAAISPLVGISAAAGLAGAVIDRVVRTALLSIGAMMLSFNKGHQALEHVGGPDV